MPRYIPQVGTYVQLVKDAHGLHLPLEPTTVLHEVVFQSGEEPMHGEIVTAECGARVKFVKGQFQPGSYQCKECVLLSKAAERVKIMEEQRIFFGSAFVETQNEVAA